MHFSTPVEPPPALGGTALAWRPPRWAILAVAAVLALAVGCGGIWLYDPSGVTALAGRARLLAAPSTATPIPTPTALPTTTPTVTPTAIGDANRHDHADRDSIAHAGANRNGNNSADADAQALAEQP